MLRPCNHPKHWANAPITPFKLKNTNQQKHGVGAAPHTQTKCKKLLQVSCPVATGNAAPGERSKHAQPAFPSYPLPLWSTRINNHHHRPTHIRVVSYLLPAGMHDAEDAAPLALRHPALIIRQCQQPKAAQPCGGASMSSRLLSCRGVWNEPRQSHCHDNHMDTQLHRIRTDEQCMLPMLRTSTTAQHRHTS